MKFTVIVITERHRVIFSPQQILLLVSALLLLRCSLKWLSNAYIAITKRKPFDSGDIEFLTAHKQCSDFEEDRERERDLLFSTNFKLWDVHVALLFGSATSSPLMLCTERAY